ncbi:(2Fe-2S)-binding protein [Clostridium botulinum]|uniref:Dehydrogenase, [2Fe-2S] binding subunit n=1 Tax=Clostridium botulinum (strain Hall / ATCC 3502 / NCTC 13319 / Type A) TaxID=441771 RepID=A5I5T6_CLOBH|nr:(2Fe-2S)-binding protein [Clostridium botulinum]EPS49064.1 xanthine dehydrogenase, iron-sulfur binding protein [Clostridium botulinum CFSAN002369]ABS33253.1 oxidoreductase, iron-sulfur binding protein [Clostridium botulinum A str. ATCC 19397]ABS39246.1 oxidoreductase, iron-sulfur binding protein [Clostridium botulinum A str. Hall]AWB18641.1 (2Fe-2S)-binding protein [Clostridium botulinum]EGT5616604.1 (2Fe-2S)-binding protein [Clostridium botulinum]
MMEVLSKTIITLNINGEYKEVVAKPSDILLHTLRNELGLTGAKPSCENGDCGACTILVDGWPIKSCLMLTVEAIGKKIVTVEGLKNAPIQKAFVDNWGFQCGYCTSGFLMVCHALANIHPDADDYVIEQWLQSNLCRCTGYEEIKTAIKSVISDNQSENNSI